MHLARSVEVLLAAILPAISPSFALSETIFKGTVQVESVVNCPDFATGLDRRSVFHPRMAGNQAFNSISIVDGFDSRAYQTDKPLLLNQAVTTVATGISAGAWTWTGPKLTINAATPALSKITAATPAVSLTFSIRSPEKDHDTPAHPCIVIWRGTYLRDHD